MCMIEQISLLPVLHRSPLFRVSKTMHTYNREKAPIKTYGFQEGNFFISSIIAQVKQEHPQWRGNIPQN